jgi:hypothetical protein
LAEFKYNRILLLLIGIGLAAALVIGWQRHVVEENNTRVEMVLDYDDVVELAEWQGLPVGTVMQQFKDAGITSLAVYETTLEKLQKNGRLTVLSGAELLDRLRMGEKVPFLVNDPSWKVSSSQAYLIAIQHDAADQSRFSEMKEDLSQRLGASQVHILNGNEQQQVMALDTNFEKILKMNIGLSSQEMREIEANGLYIVARPSNFTKVQPEDVKAVFDRIKGFKVSGVMFVGTEVLGYPNLLPITADYLTKQGLALYMIENPVQLQFTKQEGLLPLATATDYQVARTYVIPKDEQPKIEMNIAIHRWGLSDQERNIRVNLLRKFDKPEPGMNLLETNLHYVASIKRELLTEGFSLGKAGIYQAYWPNPWLLSLVIIGATAAGVLFITLLKPFPVPYQLVLLVVLAVPLIWPVLKGGGLMVRQLTAMSSAILFPTLAMTWQLDRWRKLQPFSGSFQGKVLVDGVLGLVITVFLSLMGGLYIGALLGDVRFLLEMDIFRGVKVTFVMPLVLITLSYLVRFNLFGDEPIAGNQSFVRQLGKIMDYPFQFKTMLLVGLGLLVAWVDIGRSGHTAGVPVPAIETKLRVFLENVMVARPREKEFLVGHPAFMLAVLAYYRQWPKVAHYLLVVVATIGQGSLVETFAHIRTPISMSLIRGLDGLLLGALLGVMAVIFIQVLHYGSFLLGRRPATDE